MKELKLEGYGKVTEKIPHVEIPNLFKTNLARTGLIYPKNHPYYTGVPKAELRKALAYLPPKNTFIEFDFGDNITIEVHPLHGDKELKENINISKLIKKHDPEAKIKLMPIISETDKKAKGLYYPDKYLKKYPTRNADALINGSLIEYETANGSKSSIQNAIKSGKKQADHIVIHIPDDMDMLQTDQIVKGQLKHYQSKEDLKVWLINKTNKIEYKTKQER